ncbi:acyltransferase domain-containing protein [Rhizobium leguminosarum]|uniref:acyltransferase domain-containing protein n=1 Tax=Rhizobium leguminosarum TaxID=384 RepID=UPI0013DB996C|nr:acyltransferase domain-containing protein [Rhizobium leguminosarum]NEK38626.1 acyltransferase domain-containing protein [Rhizobium leguminosarum]
MTVALLCSGQGTQHREMFRLTADLPAAAGIFSAAREALGSDPRTFVLTASEASLHANRTAQILCVTQALAAATMIESAPSRRAIVAGYSIGEVAAWGIAGLLTPQAVIDLARIRAEIMDAASRPDDGLGFLRGLSGERVAALGSRHGIEIAIVNPGDAFIVGGSRPSLLAFFESALAAGATRAGLLPVSVASHTSRLEKAVAPFRSAIYAHKPKRPDRSRTLLSGLNGSALLDIVSGADKLARQLGTTVRWDICLGAAVERGASRFLELGPGRALAEMAASAYPTIPARSTEDFRSAAGVCAWLSEFD